MKHILLHKLGVKQKDIKREIESFRTSSGSNGGFHQYIINKFYFDIEDLEGEEAADSFQTKIQDLKNYRDASDYEDVATSQADTKTASLMAKGIIENLNEYYL